MAPKALAPGVRFHPTDVELVKYYLQKKVSGKRIRFDVISEVDVYKFSPSDLPDKSQLKSMDLEWYFFCPRERKYVNGARMNRSTEFGYWKTTGRDRVIGFKDKTVGMIKTLIYHEGRAPKGNRTDWVMHEYRLKDDDLAKSGINQDAYVICKIFLKSGPGPRPTQHLFKEDDWSDDNDDDTSVNMYLTTSSFPVALIMNNPSCSTVTHLGITDGEASPIESISVLKEGDSKSISLLELPNTPKEHLYTMARQKDASISELSKFINSQPSGNQNEYSMRCEKGMHGNSCASYGELSQNAAFLAWEMPGKGNCVIPSRPVGAMVGLLDDTNDSGAIQSASLDCDDPWKLLDNFYVEGVQSEYHDDSANHPGNVQSTPLGWSDLYKDLDNFYAAERQSGCEESFIELNDLITPLDNELHWSHLVPSDDLLNEVIQNGSKVPPLSVDDYGGSSYIIAPAESQSLPQNLLGFVGSLDCADAPQKDNAEETGNSMLCCIANWKQWES